MTTFYIPPRYKRPQVFIEKPRRLSVPKITTHYSAVPQALMPRCWPTHTKKESTRSQVIRNTTGSWYKRRKTERKLKALKKKNDEQRLKIAKEKARWKLEKKYQEKERLRAQNLPEPITTRLHKKKRKIEIKEQKDKKEIIGKEEKKEKKVKETKEKKLPVHQKTTSVKPQTETKYVTVRRANNGSLGNRCENWCYRLCCQFYCCLTFILVMGFVIICIV